MIEDTMKAGLAGMAQIGTPRQPMDREALKSLVNASAEYTTGGIARPKGVQPAGDPAYFPTARPQQEFLGKAGARYGLKVPINIPVSPEAAPTQANGRVIRGRGTGQSFWGQ